MLYNRTGIAHPRGALDHYLLQILKDTTGYIEDRLLDELALDDISQHVTVSKFHLLRIWKGATGMGLMEYVRRRRLATSVADLLNRTNSLDFLANKYGFGSERAFNRAFKDEFGVTPARWRKNPLGLNIVDRFNADFMQRAGDGLIFLKAVMVLPTFSLAGLGHTVNLEENLRSQVTRRLAVEFFHRQRPRILNPVAKDVYYGYVLPSRNPSASSLFSEIYYQPSIQVNGLSIVPPDMTTRRIPAHKYGVFTYIGLHRPEEISAQDLQNLLHFVQANWEPTVEFRLKEPFRFELINYARCSKQYCECDLYFPIEGL